MKAIHFDSVGGASGDMILGALIALGADIGIIKQQVGSVIHDEFSLSVIPFESHGICGIKAQVECCSDVMHDHGGHTHSHKGNAHTHRTWGDIRSMIHQSELPVSVKKDACAVFEQLAVAEGKIHGKSSDEVHFHEVGAIDSIVDIVGSCCARALLKADVITVGPLPIGCGVIQCRHGTYPCPAPATQELLRGMTVVRTEEPYELVTPTGAALLRVWRGQAKQPVASQVSGNVVYSFGHRTLDNRPNVLRASIMHAGMNNQAEEDTCMVLQANLDDTTPELVGALFDTLMERGALDVYCIPVQMKKQRSGVMLTVLCRPCSISIIEELIFRETTTFGIRRYWTERTLLPRTVSQQQTPYGDIRIKCGTRDGHVITQAPEMDDCIKAASDCSVSVRKVYEAVMGLIHHRQ